MSFQVESGTNSSLASKLTKASHLGNGLENNNNNNNKNNKTVHVSGIDSGTTTRGPTNRAIHTVVSTVIHMQRA